MMFRLPFIYAEPLQAKYGEKEDGKSDNDNPYGHSHGATADCREDLASNDSADCAVSFHEDNIEQGNQL